MLNSHFVRPSPVDIGICFSCIIVCIVFSYSKTLLDMNMVYLRSNRACVLHRKVLKH
jgi:hypothetical protein